MSDLCDTYLMIWYCQVRGLDLDATGILEMLKGEASARHRVRTLLLWASDCVRAGW